MGDESVWHFAEGTLQAAITELGKDFVINPGDGAFQKGACAIGNEGAHQCDKYNQSRGAQEYFGVTFYGSAAVLCDEMHWERAPFHGDK